MARLLFLCQHYYPEMVSTGLHMTELTTKMHELDDSISINIFCANPSKKEYVDFNIESVETYKGIKIRRVNNLGKQHGSIFERLLFSVMFFLKSLLYVLSTNKKNDLIVCTTNPPFLAIVPYLAKKIFNKPFVLIVYDIYPDIAIKLGVIKENNILSKLYKKLNRNIYNAADKIVVIGEDMCELVKKSMRIINEDKLIKIHNWSDKNTVKPVVSIDNLFIKKYGLEGKKILMYSGNMGRTHNIEPILEAANELREDSDAVFIFIGGGAKLQMVKNFIKENELKNILLLPYQPIDTISHTLSSAALAFVCLENQFTGLSVPSKAYGIMAAGRPIIGLLDENSEIGLTIKKFDCGVVWNTNSKKSLSSLLKELLADTEKLERMAQNSYNAFLVNYDISISANKYNLMIAGIVKK